jgi:hypothetical protein
LLDQQEIIITRKRELQFFYFSFFIVLLFSIDG